MRKSQQKPGLENKKGGIKVPYLTDRMGLELAKNGVVQIIFRKGEKGRGEIELVRDQLFR